MDHRWDANPASEEAAGTSVEPRTVPSARTTTLPAEEAVTEEFDPAAVFGSPDVVVNCMSSMNGVMVVGCCVIDEVEGSAVEDALVGVVRGSMEWAVVKGISTSINSVCRLLLLGRSSLPAEIGPTIGPFPKTVVAAVPAGTTKAVVLPLLLLLLERAAAKRPLVVSISASAVVIVVAVDAAAAITGRLLFITEPPPFRPANIGVAQGVPRGFAMDPVKESLLAEEDEDEL